MTGVPVDNASRRENNDDTRFPQRRPQLMHGCPRSISDVHQIARLSTSNPQAQTPRMERMYDEQREEEYEPGVNLEFNMPACWEDMNELGLDPLTGEVVSSCLG